MTYQEALAQLRNHANITPVDDSQSLLYRLWAADREGAVLDLAHQVDVVLQCLAVANLELNGSRPSQMFGRQNPAVIPDVACLVSGLVTGLLQCHRRWAGSGHNPVVPLEALRDAALRIEMAWDMILAGDHNDLLNELEIEWNAAG